MRGHMGVLPVYTHHDMDWTCATLLTCMGTKPAAAQHQITGLQMCDIWYVDYEGIGGDKKGGSDVSFHLGMKEGSN